MSWAGCYSLDLYCDNTKSENHDFQEFPHQYTDELGSVCRANARKAGWIIRGDGSAVCPKCSGKKRAPKKTLAPGYALVNVRDL
jgi:hypothetical protein